MSNLPSVKTLETAFPGKGELLRRSLEDTNWMLGHPAAIALVKRSTNVPGLHDRRLAVVNAILEGHGVESVPPGTRKGDTEINYISMRDIYDDTLLYKHAPHISTREKCDAWCGGRWVVSNIANYVEH